MNAVGSITVREVHGIRRFLYPLTAAIVLPEGCAATDLGLQMKDGQPVPLQVIPEEESDGRSVRLDFAVSLAPCQELELFLHRGMTAQTPDDPLKISATRRFRSEQKRFSIEFDRRGCLLQAAYDGRSHLRCPVIVTRNGAAAGAAGRATFAFGPLTARISSPGRYPDGCDCRTGLEITACKSWANLTHIVPEPRSGDSISFALLLDASSPVLTCDFGVGSGLYGKLQAGSAPEVVWGTEFQGDGSAEWSLTTAGRIDYQGKAPDAEGYRSQRWFHLIDRDKSLAVAITCVPQCCRKMTVTLRATGDALLSFQLGEVRNGPAAFGVCYHFLNDIPACSAATNPQSILLPPIVEASTLANV